MQEYYIVFTQGVHWIAKLLKPNFSHIYIITRDDYNWIVLNPTRGFLQVGIAAVSITEPLPMMVALPADTILKVIIDKRDSGKLFGYFKLINCVTAVKYILGLRLCAVTPFQLFSRLLNFKPKDYKKHHIVSIERVR